MKSKGKLYGVGVGPGDPGLVTLKAKAVLEKVSTIFVPRATTKSKSLAGQIVRQVLTRPYPMAELTFPMTKDQAVLEKFWREAAAQVAAVVEAGKEAAFVTLGDPLLYSTYIYLLRMLKTDYPQVEVETVSGITSYSAAAARLGISLAEGGEKVSIIPAVQNLQSLPQLLPLFETTVLLKIGSRLEQVIQMLEDVGLLGNSLFISHIGEPEEYIETDLQKLKGRGSSLGYLSIIIVKRPAR